jgi:hypothetical protein
MAAAGVFTGHLFDADGSRIGMGSRRCTAVVEVILCRTALLARLGPVDVNLLGFRVTMAEVTVDVTRPSAAIRRRSRAGQLCQDPGQNPALRAESDISVNQAPPADRPQLFAIPECTRPPWSTAWSAG